MPRETALKHGVQVGPSRFPDREHFGRRDLHGRRSRSSRTVSTKIGALAKLAESMGLKLRHVKAARALYNMACRDDVICRANRHSCRVVRSHAHGAAGSRLQALSAGRCPFVAEGLRTGAIKPDGSTGTRTQQTPCHDPEEPSSGEWLLREKEVRTLCSTGDNPNTGVCP